MEEVDSRHLRRILLIATLVAIFFGNTIALYFTSIQTSYCEFERWNASVNGTLKFEFRTSQSEALLLYMDDGGNNDYMELVLEDGQLRFRVRIHNNAWTVFMGEALDDSLWHQVVIVRNGKTSELTLDDYSRHGSVEGQDDELTIRTNLFVGGIPQDSVDMSELSNSDAYLYKHFQGYIRNLIYRTKYARYHFERPKLLSRTFVDDDAIDLCQRVNPCDNRGLCVSTDDGPTCDCRGTGFEGEVCDVASSETEERQAISCTFDGNSYISYSLQRQAIDNEDDDIYFQFRTGHPNGLILHAGESNDFMYVALVKGLLEVAVNLGTGEFRVKISPNPGESFYDNEWHKVKVIRRRTNIEVKVDDTLRAEDSTGGSFGRLTTRGEVFIGGAPEPAELVGSTVGENFFGNLQDVSYNGHSTILDFLELAHQNDPFIHIEGRLDFSVHVVNSLEPITFLTEDSFFLLPKWNAKSNGDIFFEFRTNEPNSVLMYNRGQGSSGAIQDFFGFELLNGFIYLILNLGSGGIRHKAATFPLNDGEWHSVRLTRKGNQGTVSVDGQIDENGEGSFVTPGDSTHLNLGDSLVVGGINNEDENDGLPLDLFAGAIRQGFVGCMRNLLMETLNIDFSRYIREQGKEDEIRPYCRSESDKCDLEPCRHGGICREGWNRFICDCTMTSYSGPTCEEDATRVSFNGVSYVRVTLKRRTQTKFEDIFFRFKTRFPEGMLVETSSPGTIDVMLIELHQGHVRVTTNFGSGRTVLTVGDHLDNNNWHSVHVVRQESTLMVTVDNTERSEAYNITQGRAPEEFEGGILDNHYIDIGGYVSPENHLNPPGFIGQMEQFVYNSKYYFELAEKYSVSSIMVTASFEDDIPPRPVVSPFTFQTKEVFVSLQTPSTYPRLTFFFHFKTTEPEGLIFFDRGIGQDFIAVELLAGRLHYVFNRGSGSTSIQDSTMHPLNDNKWHEVWIFRNSRDRDLLMVDGIAAADRAAEGASNIDLTENLRVGGMLESDYGSLPVMVQSRTGYQGCFGSLEINYEHQDLSAEKAKNDQLKEGCTELSTFCNEDVCDNGGLCLAGWEAVTCDCSATSFTGKNCSESSITFAFGAAGGLISLSLPEDQWMTTDRDEISMGFVTTSEDAVLMRIDSADSDDYIEMEIVKGKLVVVYNFGTEDIPIKATSVIINNGEYHVVHFFRKGANATLQIDNNAPQHAYPRGRQAQHFNKQQIINIGGRGLTSRRRKRRAVERSFEGQLSGISYNEIRPLDIAAAGDPRITIQGDVRQTDLVLDETWPSRAPNRIGTTLITTVETLPEFSTDNDLREVSKLPTVSSPPGSSNENPPSERVGPPKKNPLIMPTADGIHEVDGRNIFITTSGCITDDDEGCTAPPLSPNRIISPDTTPGAHLPEDDCGSDDEDCTTGSGSPDTGKDKNDNFTFTTTTNIPVKSKPKSPTADEGVTEDVKKNDTVKGSGGGLDFLAQTSLVLGLVASGAILFIVFVLVLYRCRNRNEGSYHINESRNYDEATRTSLLPTTTQTNGAVPPKPKPKLPPEYATKEWYV
ncbi:neurexin-1-like isoform X4 [Apostichopus japonicus]|uniref:neurexin-1-like isoform X4 n=1 Tax=Stichopus japonicus TaxID=307972 RepID=UPI003AB32117